MKFFIWLTLVMFSAVGAVAGLAAGHKRLFTPVPADDTEGFFAAQNTGELTRLREMKGGKPELAMYAWASWKPLPTL